MKYRTAEKKDLAEIKEILKQSNLPTEDCDSHVDNFIVAEQERKIIGTGGIEIYGALGLVRSIVVIPEYRGKGISREILTILESRAYDRGVNILYLLTETAEEYFKNLGFSVKNRLETPEAIVNTKQFSNLCPSTAKVMRRDINKKLENKRQVSDRSKN